MKLRCSVTQFVGVEEGQVASCESTMHGVFISVWSVRCRLCRLHKRHLHKRIEEHKGSAIRRKPPQKAARRGARRHRTEFSKLKNVSEQIWLSYFEMFFYKRTETNAKQIVRFNSRQIICLEQFLLRLFIIFYHILAFATFLSILTCFNIFMLI